MFRCPLPQLRHPGEFCGLRYHVIYGTWFQHRVNGPVTLGVERSVGAGPWKDGGMLLADLLTPADPVKLHFLDEGTQISLSQMWAAGESVSPWLESQSQPAVAAVLSNSSSCASFLLGCIGAGTVLVSVPPPPRSVDLEWYAQFVERACSQAGASVLAVEADYLPLLPPRPGLSYVSFQEVLNTAGRGSLNAQEFTLIQFSSGSTADPKGIVLEQERIAKNVQGILEWLQPHPGDGACSWLPLSHDMGLIGMFFSAIAGGGNFLEQRRRYRPLDA